MKEFGETYGLDKESIMQYLEIKKDISIIENMHCVLGESRLLELYPRMKAIMRSDKFRQAIMNPRIKKKISPSYLLCLKTCCPFVVILYHWASETKIDLKNKVSKVFGQ